MMMMMMMMVMMMAVVVMMMMMMMMMMHPHSCAQRMRPFLSCRNIAAQREKVR
jgi:hypothetical protein